MRIIILFLSGILFLNSCTGSLFGIIGKGPMELHELSISSFDNIQLDMPATVLISQGPIQSITVESQENIFDLLNKEVKNGTWVIKPKTSIKDFEKVTIKIKIPKLNQIINSSTGTIITEESIQNNQLIRIISNGTGNIRVNGNFSEVEMYNQGTGNISLEGNAQRLDIILHGIGNVNAFQLKADYVTVKTDAMGDCEIAPNKTLNVTLSGIGDVFYKGTPNVASAITGMGKLVQVK